MESTTSDAVGSEVLFENDRIRVWEMVLKPGESSSQHRHLLDYLYVYVTASDIAVRVSGGTEASATYEDGYVQYREVGSGIEHQIRNIGASDHRQIIVEIKGASRSTTPQTPQTNRDRRRESPAIR